MQKSNKNIKKVAILASGGNAPGMNNAVITFVRKANILGFEPYLIYGGFKGAYEKNIHKASYMHDELLGPRGNIFIGSSRFPEFKNPEIRQKTAENLREFGIDAVFVIGGDGSYMGAKLLSDEGIYVMGLPGTIDNDISSTDETIGFYTCLNQICESLDALKDTFESHNGICLVEVMGRGFSDLAIYSGIACCAQAIVTKDNLITKEQFLEVVRESEKNNRKSCLIVVTEQLYGRHGLDSLQDIAAYLGKQTGRLARVNVIGHTQRGGVTAAWDRALASMMSSRALELLDQGIVNRVMAAQHGELVHFDIVQAYNMPRKKNRLDLVKEFAKINIQ